MNLAEAKKFLDRNNVKSVLAQFVDIHGAAKAKSVPAAHFEDILNAVSYTHLCSPSCPTSR